MYRTILVPVDGSPTAARGLAEAIRLAQLLRSRLRLLHVIGSTPWLSASGMPVTEDVLALLTRQGESLLADAAAAAHAAGVEAGVQLTLSLGDEAGAVIVAEARATHADLIVCGTHGRRGLQRALMGSDAEHVVRHTPVPVLLIREPGADEADETRAAA